MSHLSLLLESSPPDWAPASFSDVCVRVKDAASPSADGERLYLGLEHLASGLPALVGRGTESDVRSGKTSFRSGDVLFGKLRPYLRKSVLVGEEGICSTDILVFRATEKCIPEFICLLTHTDEFVGHAKATTSGVQHPRTSWSGLREFKLHVPPVPEQRKIAGVLGVVQRAIEQQERLLALTIELKKALLHQVFTAGIRGEPQKLTEISLVPKSWEVVPLSDCCTVQTGVAKGRKIDEHEALILPYLRVANVQSGYLDLTEMKTVTIHSKEKERYLLHPGDVVLTEGGDFDKLGRGFIWKGEVENCIHQNHIFAVRVDLNKLLPEFFAYLSQSPYGKAYFLSVAHKTTNLACINTTKLKGFPVLIPTRTEQEEIVQILESVDTKLANHTRMKRLLDSLFRTLLHQLMTAQIRVHDLDLSELETATME
jgi:type I restriction enzyme S subunit